MNLPKLTLVYDRCGRASKTKPATVELKISMGGRRKYISTGVKLLPMEWKDGAVVRRDDWRELNKQLQALKNKVADIIAQMIDEGELELDGIPSRLEGSVMVRGTFLEYCREQAELRYKKIDDSTIGRYKVFFRFMEKWKGIVSFSDVTERNVLRMDEVLSQKGLKVATRWNYHKTLKMFIKMAVNDGLLKKNPYARIELKREESSSGLQRFLTPEEFHKFEKCKIPYPRMERVRDLFVFQTYTCMSYSDLAAFSVKNCEMIGGQMVYKANRTKTGQEFVSVIVKPAKAILDKYQGELPMLTNQKYNDFLKGAVMYAGILKPVTSHWARHTGATLLLNEGGLSMHIVQHVLGHASIRETEKTYAKVLDKTIVEEVSAINWRKGKKKGGERKGSPQPRRRSSRLR